MRSSLIAVSLLLSSAAYAADETPAGDAPSKEAKAAPAKPDMPLVVDLGKAIGKALHR